METEPSLLVSIINQSEGYIICKEKRIKPSSSSKLPLIILTVTIVRIMYLHLFIKIAFGEAIKRPFRIMKKLFLVICLERLHTLRYLSYGATIILRRLNKRQLKNYSYQRFHLVN